MYVFSGSETITDTKFFNGNSTPLTVGHIKHFSPPENCIKAERCNRCDTADLTTTIKV
ncbi:hypothetical protein DPMN_052012 [Dreissena polymorpha]|uniref:Uncharacterized protein n=1 Tax=Dreissena polymorpha TaxID=45954 RepID=A0A9D4CL35_DREPO|nr:hypothetical protein DPMN_052012 [Dreissena polymorpha]